MRRLESGVSQCNLLRLQLTERWIEIRLRLIDVWAEISSPVAFVTCTLESATVTDSTRLPDPTQERDYSMFAVCRGCCSCADSLESSPADG